MNRKNKVILVTGASSGLGLAAAGRLSEIGHTVYAGARSFPDNPLEENASLKKVHLDVTDPENIRLLVQRILDREDRIDVLVNCAAMLVLGSVEDTSPEEYRKVFDTNLGGTIRMCKAVLPHMRSRREGLIINFSSIMGLLAVPFQSAYTSSKFAIEGFTEALSMEARNWGIKVVMLEPTDHKSGSQKYRLRAKNADLESSPYRDLFQKVTARIEYDEAHGSEPEDLARLVEKIIRTGNPKLRYRAGKLDQKCSVALKRILPGRVFESLISSYYYSGRK